MKYLGIDYGKRKIGLALSEGEMPEAWKVITAVSLKDAVVKISRIIRDENIGELVIGKPESGEALKLVTNFVREISKQIRVNQIEETLSSHHAIQQMNEYDFSSKQREKEDALAAAEILQNYLDSIKVK